LNQATSTNCIFHASEFTDVKDKVLNWANRFDTFSFLDNHGYSIQPHSQECILAAGITRSISVNAGTAMKDLQSFIDGSPAWLFGHLGYDLKNEFEDLESNQPDGIGFPDVFFFEPEVLVRFDHSEISVETTNGDAKKILDEILNEAVSEVQLPNHLSIKTRFSKEAYVDTVTQLRSHILRGDCYEINFCQEFFSENVSVDPVSIYKRLAKISPNPFSALYRINDRWLICASPERFIKKEGRKLFSQPIKGTSKRVLMSAALDADSLYQLSHSDKERSENVMIVDLVRNDLSKLCTEGSVKVEELFGLYSFPQVHQMISTVSGQLRDDVRFTDVVKGMFPMGSMTGAPKKKVMELIEQYERTKRGVFSGALGYINPAGDFDFNVIIRSILYNATEKYLSFQTGSAITFYSDPEKEWEECLLKAEAMRAALVAIRD
jgi:para-aminobenzoate synthetase component 1